MMIRKWAHTFSQELLKVPFGNDYCNYAFVTSHVKISWKIDKWAGYVCFCVG